MTRDLTIRQKEVLNLIIEGKTSDEIAKSLFITKKTVEGHRSMMLSRYSCNNIAELIYKLTKSEVI